MPNFETSYLGGIRFKVYIYVPGNIITKNVIAG